VKALSAMSIGADDVPPGIGQTDHESGMASSLPARPKAA